MDTNVNAKLPTGMKAQMRTCLEEYAGEFSFYIKTTQSFRYNECLNPKDNDCAKEADCIDTDDGYLCQCKTGFFDESQDPQKTGRVCIGNLLKES